MRLKEEEIPKLARYCCEAIYRDSNNSFKVSQQEIQKAIESVLRDHFNQEKSIEEEAEKLYHERASEFEGLERSKAIPKLKQQIAKEKDFILSGGNEGRFSPDKISHMAHLIGDKLYDDDLMDFPDEDDGPKVFKKLLTAYFGEEEEMDVRARKKIASLSNPPMEGSKEWEILFRKYREEEVKRRGR